MSGTLAPAIRIANDAMNSLYRELTEMRLVGERGRISAATALAVTLATVLALAVNVDDVWWAAISAFMCSQATAPASVRRGILRILGTIAGAGLSLMLSPWLAGDQVALSLALFSFSTAGMLGMLVSRHGYAWLLGGVTADMVLMALLSDPLSALSVGVERSAEVTIGTVAAMLVALLVEPDADVAPVLPGSGWSDLCDARHPAVSHALRAGFAVMMVPLVWRWLELPSLSQTAITVAAVMALPALSNDAVTDQQKIAERAVHRILGCLFGGVVGLSCLALSVESFLPWLLLLTAGIWIAAHVQASRLGVGYIGSQAAVVFILTLVQGRGPPLRA
jgi:uncharacterized membrane protein YccC